MEAPPRLDPVSSAGDEDGDDWVLLSGWATTEQLWYSLPAEVLQHIFSYLAPKDLCAVALVDVQCRILASDDALWLPLARRRWPVGVLPKAIVTSWKHIYSELASEEHGTAMRFVVDRTKFLCDTDGQEITGTVYLKLAHETQIRGLFLSFEGREFSRHRKGKHTDIKRHIYFTVAKTIAGRFAYAERSRESLVLAPGPHQFPFSLAVPAASDSGVPMQRSFNFPDRNVRYELTVRLVRPGIFNFDIARSHVLDFCRQALPDDALISSPPVSVSMHSSYIFGAQIEMQATPIRTHWRGGETLPVTLEVLNRSNWAVLSAEMNLYLESHTAGYKPFPVTRTQKLRYPFRAIGGANVTERQTLLLPIPRDITPTVHCRFFTMRWAIEVSVNVELQLAPFIIRVPIELVESEHEAAPK